MASTFGMSEVHRAVLRRNRVFLLRNIEPSVILCSQLKADGVLTRSMMETVLFQLTTSGKNAVLLDTITRRGSDAFKNFVKALKVSQQNDVAAFLEKCAQEINLSN